MSLYQIELDDKAIIEQINAILETIINNEITFKYSESNKEISCIIKELVYSRKDEITERVVDRAAKEIVKKGLPRLLDRLEGEKT